LRVYPTDTGTNLARKRKPYFLGNNSTDTSPENHSNLCVQDIRRSFFLLFAASKKFWLATHLRNKHGKALNLGRVK